MSELNQLSTSKYAYLSRLSVEELLDLLSVAPIPATSPEQEAYVDALKEAIIEKENQTPTGFFPDPHQQWKQFVTYYLPDAEEAELEPDCTEGAASEYAGQPTPDVPPKRAHRFKHLWRTLLIAAAAVGCMFAAMVTAQASGLDVFGAMARWTEEAFSFAQVPANSRVTDQPKGNKSDARIKNYSSLQEALDTYGITQVHEPTKLPDGFVVNECGVECSEALHTMAFYAEYVNDRERIAINIMNYEGEPIVLTQKTEELPSPVGFNEATFYFIENASSSIVTWYDDEYEYYVSGKLEKDILWEIAASMYE